MDEPSDGEQSVRIDWNERLKLEEVRERFQNYLAEAVTIAISASGLLKIVREYLGDILSPVPGLLAGVYAMSQFAHVPKELYRRVWLPWKINRELDKCDGETIYIE